MRFITYTPALRCSSPSLLAANPFTALEAEMSRLLGTNNPNGTTEAVAQEGWIPVELHDDETSYQLRASLPGVAKEDISMEILDGELNLRAQRRWKNGQTEHTQNFARSISLSEDVATEKISANYENGLLTLSLPKREQAKPRKITLN